MTRRGGEIYGVVCRPDVGAAGQGCAPAGAAES